MPGAFDNGWVGAAMVARLLPYQTQVYQQHGQQQHTFKVAQLFVERQDEHQQAGADHQWDVQAHQLPGNPQRDNQGAQAKGNQDIENVAAKHAADGDVRCAASRGLHAYCQLRCTAAECNHGQADDQGAYFQARSQAQRSTHQQLGAADQQ
ncbi:hypothetical protein D3C76_1093640 [compost metagenome]